MGTCASSNHLVSATDHHAFLTSALEFALQSMSQSATQRRRAPATMIAPARAAVAALGRVAAGAGYVELALIVAYIFSLDAALKLFWRATFHLPRAAARPVDWARRRGILLFGGESQLKESSAWRPLSPRGESFEASAVAALLPAARLLGWCLALLWALNLACLGAVELGLATRGEGRVPKVLEVLVLASVLGRAFAAWKNHALDRFWTRRERALHDEAQRASGGASGRAAAAAPSVGALNKNRFLSKRGSDLVLWLCVGAAALDAAGLSAGVAARSLLSFAGLGGLAVGLATKDLAANLVGGCLVFLTQPFAEGDKVSFAKLSAKFKVKSIGWYKTTVVSDDEQV